MTLPNIHLRVSTAATGTCPPDSVFDREHNISTRCPSASTALKRPVQPSPVWISSAMSKVPYFGGRAPGASEIIVVGDIHALALNWLDNECRHPLRVASASSSATRSLNSGPRRTVRQHGSESIAGKLSSPFNDSAP